MRAVGRTAPSRLRRLSPDDVPTHRSIAGSMLRVKPLVRIFARTTAVYAALGCMTIADPESADRSTPIEATFAAFWTAARARPIEVQESLWDQIVERPRRELYASVVWEVGNNARWKTNKQRLLRQRFLEYPRLSGQIAQASSALTAEIAIQENRFRTLFPDAPASPSVQLLLAPNFDAKSGALGDGTPVLVFAVDSLVLEGADLGIIVPHELFHLYDATHAGIKNDGVMPDANLFLPLFAEGLATYVSSVLSPGHSDGELLLQGDLGALPSTRLAEVAGRFLEDAGEQASGRVPPAAFRRWFTGSRRQFQSDLPNRTGYWLGLHVIRRIQSRYPLREMASWGPSKAQMQTRAALLDLVREEK